MTIIPTRIAQIRRVVEGIAEPVRPNACCGDFEPVGLGEEGEIGVVGAGVEVDEAGGGGFAFADVGFVVGGIGVSGPLAVLAAGVEGAFDVGGGAFRDQGDGV